MLGNQGNDTLYGSGGRDWVVGGQISLMLFGNDGADIVYGNRGRRHAETPAPAMTPVRGGQDDDVVSRRRRAMTSSPGTWAMTP